MSVSEDAFITAVLDANLDTPDGLCNPEGTPAQKRFSVYRNNVAVSLTEALAATFPTVQKLVGGDFFNAMAGVFLRQHQPTSPILMLYGAEMPDFLSNFAPVAHLEYLPDIARIELAMTRSYHAADLDAITAETLQKIPPDALLTSQFHFAPTVHLIRSKWPVAAIYHANNDTNAPKPVMQVEDALITRPEFDPTVQAMPAGGGAFVHALLAGKTMGDALTAANIASGDFDLSQTLGLLLANSAIINIAKGNNQ